MFQRHAQCNWHSRPMGWMCKLVCVLLLPALGAAQDQQPDLSQMSLEDLLKIKVESVIGASKHLQRVTEVAASVTIVTADDIQNFGYRTLADILRSVPGFYVTYDRNYSYAAVRGLGRTGDYNERILLLVDGHRMNDDIYGLAFIGTEFPVDVDLIERVEVIHGPSAAMYGDNAFFAVINVVTKSGGQVKGFQVATSMASYDTGYGRVTYGGRSKNWEALLSTSLYDSHGQEKLFFPDFNSPTTSNGIAHNADYDKYRQVFAKISYKDLTLQVVYGPREKGVPTASFGTVFNDGQERTTDRTGYADLGYQHKFGKGFDFTAHVYDASYTYDGFFPYNYSPGTGTQITLNHDYQNAAWWGEEVKVSKRLLSRHLITVGNEYRNNFRQTQANYDVQPFALYLNNHHSSGVSSVYAQDEYSIRKNLVLNLGVRHDQDYTYGGSTSPRFGLIYNPLAHTTIKLLYGTAFRAPNAYETYYTGAGLIPNSTLRPETIRTTEAVLEQYIGDHYRISGSIFANRVSQIIKQTTLSTGLLQFQNGGAARAQGAELVLERKWQSGVSANINYTYETTYDPQTRTNLNNTPTHIANLNVLVPVFTKKLTAGLDLHYAGSAGTLDGNRTQGFVVTNLTLFSHKICKEVELSGSVYNLFDTRYGYPGGGEHVQDVIYQDGRSARLKLSYTFHIEDKAMGTK